MTKRMLIDATHAEETRVVVLDGTRLEDFDVETSTKQQLKGNIYLAKVVRVEPSLQAAFVEYGGNRHGFLAFGEIHPDYYQIPVADRLALIAQQEEEARIAEAEEDAAAAADERGADAPHLEEDAAQAGEAEHLAEAGDFAEAGGAAVVSAAALELAEVPSEPALDAGVVDGAVDGAAAAEPPPAAQAERIVTERIIGEPAEDEPGDGEGVFDTAPEAALAELGLAVAADGEITGDPEALADLAEALAAPVLDDDAVGGDEAAEDGDMPPAPPETIGGESDGGGESESSEERERRPRPSRSMRAYKIQEVIRRRQIMLVQVVKEERGGKGAALTTYVSLAGRFCVLMPNSPRGGGISRKITSASDRRRLKEVTAELDLPAGMGLIVRTAGAARPKPEIVRDCEYLLQLWDDIRETTLKSVAPAAIYEEASLIKRAIRDVYSRDVEEVLVDGEAAWRAARDQMRLLMPAHASKVQLWHDPAGAPLFAKHGVDAQLDAMMSPNVQLRSGGYLVINQTEALVAVDVNSGRSTRERGIEETALRTNLEAAEELARQLRLRDLAGLIVIDFIDMEARKHNAMVEKKLQDALKNDRARIQLGTISHFGLMEMSRQRLRPSLTETNFVQCPHCAGAGHVRSTEGSAIAVLRAIEEEGAKRRSAEIMVHVAPAIAMYVLNHKRDRLREIEARSGMAVVFTPDASLLPPALRIEKLRGYAPGEAPAAVAVPAPVFDETVTGAGLMEMGDAADLEDLHDEDDEAAPAEARAVGQASARAEGDAARVDGDGKRRRRRRRRGGRRDEGAREEGVAQLALPDAAQPEVGAPAMMAAAATSLHVEMGDGALHVAPGGAPMLTPAEGEDEAPAGGARRRGRRGGRRRRRDGGEAVAEATTTADAEAEDDVVASYAAPTPYTVSYTGPTPADPFGGGGFDIFDVMEMAEQAAEAAAAAAAVTVAAAVAVPVVVAPVVEVEVVAEVVAAEPEAASPVKAPAKRRSRAKVKPVAEAPTEAAEPTAVVPEPEPEPEPLVKPVMVEDAPVAPKRGWWRK